MAAAGIGKEGIPGREDYRNRGVEFEQVSSCIFLPPPDLNALILTSNSMAPRHPLHLRV